MTDWLYITLTAVIILLGATNIWFIYRVLRPLQRLTSQTSEVAQGDLLAFQQPCGGIPEIELLRHTMASMAGHVRRTQEETVLYRGALTNGQEAERARIAHELHDDTIQSLIAIGQTLELASKNPSQPNEMLKVARSQVVETVESLRRLIANLRPPALEELGLIPALQMLADAEPEIGIAVVVRDTERRIDEAHELVLFRAAHEAVRNARHHGQATHITVEVEYQLTRVQLTVKDNGIGFLPPESLDCLTKEGHYGLLGIQERVQYLNGKMQISSEPNRGTTLIVSLPLNSLQQPEEVVRDPVCGAVIQPRQAYGSITHEGHSYYFCCPICQGAFQSDPNVYLHPMK